MGEVTYDVVGLGDDSVFGERLHLFGRRSIPTRGSRWPSSNAGSCAPRARPTTGSASDKPERPLNLRDAGMCRPDRVERATIRRRTVRGRPAKVCDIEPWRLAAFRILAQSSSLANRVMAWWVSGDDVGSGVSVLRQQSAGRDVQNDGTRPVLAY